MKKLFFVLSAVLLLASCNTKQNKALMEKSSSGKTLEVLVAADQGNYDGATRQLIDSIFRQPQLGLPQAESRFDVTAISVAKLNNTSMFQKYRNIVICEVAANGKDKVYIDRDKWAAPQTVVHISAKNEASLRDLLRRYEPNMVKSIYEAEHRRMIKAFDAHKNHELMQRVKDHFGFGMTFSEEFSWGKGSDGFAWIRKETKDFSLGVLIYVSPYRNQGQFEDERLYNRLDTMMRRNVPGPSEGGYMGTERRVALMSHKVDYPGTEYCIETHGLWSLHNTRDRMGGPFVSYSMLSPDGKNIVDVVGFVYAPRFNKRDYLMQVEGICNSVKWTE